MKILQLSPQYPFEETDGGKKGIAMFFNGFRHEGHHVTFFCYHENPEKLHNIPENVLCIRHSTKNTLLRKIVAVFDRKPLYLRKHYSDTLFDTIASKIIDTQFDIIHADHTAMAEMALALGSLLGIPVALRLHNVEWKIWQRYSERLSVFSFGKYFIQRQCRLLQKQEISLCKECDICLTVTETDKQCLENFVQTTPIVTVPYGISFHNTTVSNFDKKRPYSLLMATNWSWRHNVEGAEWFIKNVMPILQSQFPQITLFLLGKDLPPHFSQFDSNYVKCEGFVDTITEYYDRSYIFISPLFVGSGIRVKILEALSFGLPVIATTVGAEGIDLSQKDGLFVSDSPEMQAKIISDLFQQPDKLTSISLQAVQSVKESYDAANIIKKTLKVYQQCLDTVKPQ